MTDIEINGPVKEAINQAWNRKSARINLERWLSICEREKWGSCPENILLLTQVFGASWYFTRFVYFRGKDIVHFLDSPSVTDFSRKYIKDRILNYDWPTDLEEAFDQLRIVKNELMFQVFLSYLEQNINQEKTEVALTRIAEEVLQYAIILLARAHSLTDNISILAMGRMAGREMNFGSDLDLIFLYSKDSVHDTSKLIKIIQALLRHIAVPTPCGILYEIDMRLRPHGTSGALISPSDYFIEYHQGEREIWERQMMTRCRPVIDDSRLAEIAIKEIRSNIFQNYDLNLLKSEIVNMRRKVQQELGNPKGKYEIKRGRGGIMDIDFLTHFLQLQHGQKYSELQSTSTREVLRKLGRLQMIKSKYSDNLLGAYDFFKKIEGALRVMDMKNISSFSQDPENIEAITLARVMEFRQESTKNSAKLFLEKYSDITSQVRNCFNDVVGEVD